MITIVWSAVLVLLARENLTETIAWHTDYGKSLKVAERHDRPLFIVFDSGETKSEHTSGTGSFLSDSVEKALVADYVRMFVDTDTDEGLLLAVKFGVVEFPRIVIIDRSGEWQVYTHSWIYTSEDILSTLNRFRRTKITRMSPTIIQAGSTTSSSFSATLCKT